MKSERYAVMWMIIYILSAIIIALIFCGCASTKYIPVETIRNVYHNTTDTIRDSISHTVYVNQYMKGDTVFKERVESLYINKWKVHDSIVIKHDSIPYPVEVIKEVEKPTPAWQYGVLVLAGLVIAWQVRKWYKKVFKQKV